MGQRKKVSRASAGLAIGSMLLAGIYAYSTSLIPNVLVGDPVGPKLVPYLLAGGLALTAVLIMFDDVGVEDNHADNGEDTNLVVVLAAVAWTALYFFALEPAGYLLATATYLFGLILAFARRLWQSSLIVSVCLALASYVLFTKLLSVPLPNGIAGF